MTHIQVQRKLVPNDRTAEIRLEISRLGWRPYREKRVAGVHCGISEFKIKIAVEIAGSGLCDDFGTAEADAAEFRAVRIVADADFLNLILWRNSSAGESIDNKCCTAAC